MTRARVLRVAVLAVLVMRVALWSSDARADAAEAKKIFTTRCMACHTFGKGVKVGPDLKGVNERRQRAWIVKFVRSSSTVIASGDPIAAELFEQFKQQRMPDWSDLSEDQVNSILDWLGVNGPDQQDPDAKSAELATMTDIETGRELFHGARAMANGGSACATCHSIRDEGATSGGTLAPELTQAYSRYQDVAMTLFLKAPCFLRYPESRSNAFLTPEESYALKSYLRTAALTAQPASTTITAVVKEGSGAPPIAGAATTTESHAPRVRWEPPTRNGGPGIGHAAHLQSEMMFRGFPYAALVILLIGLALRYALGRRDPDAMKPAALAAWRQLTGSRPWRIGVAVTLILHLIGLVAPGAILGWNASAARLYFLEGTGFLLGVLALIGVVQLLARQLARSETGAIELGDCVLLAVLGVAIVSGLVTAGLYRWGSSWGAETLAPYLTSLAQGTPTTALVEEMPFLVRLHVFAWFVVVALVPFTSLATMLLPAIDRVMMLVARPVSAGAAMGKRLATRLSPARWLWPEEDHLDVRGDDNANAQEH